MGRAVQIERIIGDKEGGQLPREQQIDQPPQRGDGQRDARGHAVGPSHPVIVLCPEIVAVDGLDGGGHAHEHGVGDLIDLHHHAVHGQGGVAAV